ncbi:cyclic nucleotide-binding domain-containing protein [Aliiroseovarius crassostreae]|uniref:cyclic nucleotide-binding domain-containing protein n=1 Tax=Aliiroseovarius crassostreae TaxID=154981 RepID=UPI003C7C0350
MRETHPDTLGSLPFFSQLSPHVRACLIQKSTSRTYRRGENIALQGDQNPTLKIMVSGWVKLFRVTSGGEEAALAMLERGQSFDEVPALSSSAAIYSSEASPTVPCCILTSARSAPAKTPLPNCIWPS